MSVSKMTRIGDRASLFGCSTGGCSPAAVWTSCSPTTRTAAMHKTPVYEHRRLREESNWSNILLHSFGKISPQHVVPDDPIRPHALIPLYDFRRDKADMEMFTTCRSLGIGPTVAA